MGIRIRNKGGLNRTKKFLTTMKQDNFHKDIIARYAEEGLAALKKATPKDTGQTAANWSYTIQRTRGKTKVIYTNDRMAGNGKTPLVILIQYGHGTRNGGYVQGIDFINPSLKPIFDGIANDIWKVMVRK